MTDEQIRLAGLEAIRRELGPAGLIRFLQHYEKGEGNYTLDREVITGEEETVHSVAEKIKEYRTNKQR